MRRLKAPHRCDRTACMELVPPERLVLATRCKAKYAYLIKMRHPETTWAKYLREVILEHVDRNLK